MINNDEKQQEEFEEVQELAIEDDSEEWLSSKEEDKEYKKIEFTIQRETKTISEIYDIISGENEEIKFIFKFDAQRNFVWNDKKKCKLIDSIFYGLPINIIWLISKGQNSKEYYIVDGKQRISTIQEFLSNNLSLNANDMISFNGTTLKKTINKKKYSDLPNMLKQQIDDYEVDLYLINPNEDIDKNNPAKMIFEIFNRLNSNTPLSQQEVRNALYPSKFNEKLKRFVQDDKTINYLIPNNFFTRLKTCEMFYRFLGGLNAWDTNSTEECKCYKKFESVSNRITGFMKKMQEEQNTDENVIDKYLDILKKTLDKVQFVFGKYAFKKYEQNEKRERIYEYKKSINVPLFETQLFFFYALKNEYIKKYREEIKESYEKMFLLAGEKELDADKHNKNVIDFLYDLRAATGDPKKMLWRINYFFSSLKNPPLMPNDYENNDEWK